MAVGSLRAGSSGIIVKRQRITTSGTFVVPSRYRMNTLKVIMCGAGGGGGSGSPFANNSNNGTIPGGGGGGGGATLAAFYPLATPNLAISVVIGAGGAGGIGVYPTPTAISGAISAFGVDGSAGGTTTFGVYSAPGGGAGLGAAYPYNQNYNFVPNGYVFHRGGAGGTFSRFSDPSAGSVGGNYYVGASPIVTVPGANAVPVTPGIGTILTGGTATGWSISSQSTYVAPRPGGTYWVSPILGQSLLFAAGGGAGSGGIALGSTDYYSLPGPGNIIGVYGQFGGGGGGGAWAQANNAVTGTSEAIAPLSSAAQIGGVGGGGTGGMGANTGGGGTASQYVAYAGDGGAGGYSGGGGGGGSCSNYQSSATLRTGNGGAGGSGMVLLEWEEFA